MSKLTIYGAVQGRPFRTYWMAKELDLDYDAKPYHFRDDVLRSDAYKHINPNARVPAIDDDGFILWESMAINLYLARKHGGPLQPADMQGEALATQWSFWVMSEVEHPLLTVLMHSRVLPEAKRDTDRASRNRGVLRTPFKVLDGALRDRDYLVEGRFTVADLNVAAVLSWCKPARVQLNEFPDLEAWLARCLDRPARKRAQNATP